MISYVVKNMFLHLSRFAPQQNILVVYSPYHEEFFDSSSFCISLEVLNLASCQ